MIRQSFLGLMAVGSAGALTAQGPSNDDPRTFTAVDDEIRYARSAAPAHVSQHASVYVLRDGRYVLGVEGSSEVTCMVARSRPGSLEPICYDAEASRTIMQIEIRRNEMRFAGLADDEIDSAVHAAIGAGELPLPQRPAMSYMLSSGQMLVADDGRSVGNWLPHLMLYMPYMTAEQMGLYGPPSPQAAMVFDEGQPTAHLIVVVRQFIDP